MKPKGKPLQRGKDEAAHARQPAQANLDRCEILRRREQTLGRVNSEQHQREDPNGVRRRRVGHDGQPARKRFLAEDGIHDQRDRPRLEDVRRDAHHSQQKYEGNARRVRPEKL